MYLLSRIFPGSELDALAAPEGRFRKVGFFEGSHDPVRLSSPGRFLNPAGFEESENREPAPLGAELLESDPREVELLESEPLDVEFREPDPLNSGFRESEPREVELLEPDPLNSEPLESELRDDRRRAASRLEAEAPLDRSVVLPDVRLEDPLEPDPPEAELSDARPPLEVSRAPELLEAELPVVAPLAGLRTEESGFE